MRHAAAILVLVLLSACGGSPTEPDESQVIRGRLGGLVTLEPGPPPLGGFGDRKVLVYDETGASLLFTVDIDNQGAYLIDLLPGRYSVDYQGAAGDTTADVPRVVEIRAFELTRVDIHVTA